MEQITVGIPRGLLYFRYRTVWKTLFKELGFKVIVSEPTTQETADIGSALTVDEGCLAQKLFFGHVSSLVGRCDYIFIPRIRNYGKSRELCVRFMALYDMAVNMFRGSGQKFLTYSVDEWKSVSEKESVLELAKTLDLPTKRVKAAYKTAVKADEERQKELLQKQSERLKRNGLKILIAAHSYVIEDNFVGKPITEYLKKSGAVPIRADVVDRDSAFKKSLELSSTCKWTVNQEIMSGILSYEDRVDGIILLSTFPCGQDAMVNELILRRVGDMPMLNLVVDGQSGTAGLETRLESFLDIIRFKKGAL